MRKIINNRKSIWFPVISTILLFAGFMSYPTNQNPQIVEAAQQGQVMITSSYEKRRGTVSLSVLVSDVEGVSAGSLELHYDKDVGYVTGAEKGDALPNNALFVNNTEKARDGGVIKTAWASEESLEEGTLLTLDFRLILRNRKDSTKLDLSNVQLFGENGDPISLNVVDGGIRPFEGEEKTSEKGVDSNKSWTITFSTPMNRSTLNPHTITVTEDRSGDEIPIKVQMSKDKKSVTVSPVKHYIKGNYKLTISDQIQSAHGNSLKEAVQLSFTVK